jgi:hypothetical protein
MSLSFVLGMVLGAWMLYKKILERSVEFINLVAEETANEISKRLTKRGE